MASPFDFEVVDAVRLDESSILRASHGCFCVHLADGKRIRLVNMRYDLFALMIQMKEVAWPIKVTVLRDHVGLVCDPRIMAACYHGWLCENCTPADLLPITQRLHKFLEFQRIYPPTPEESLCENDHLDQCCTASPGSEQLRQLSNGPELSEPIASGARVQSGV